MTSLETLLDQLNDLDHQTSEPNCSLDTVLLCLSTPLDWLEDQDRPLTSKRALVQHSTWKRHLWHLCETIVPHWMFSLSLPEHRKRLEASWGYAADTHDQIKVMMIQASLPILLECLSRQDHASLETLEAYASFLQSISLSHSVFCLYGNYISKTDVSFFCSLVCSIPSHLNNAFAIQFDRVRFNSEHAWYIDRHYYAKMSSRAAKYLTDKSSVFTHALLGKMIRQGYEVARLNPDHWPCVFEQIELIASYEQVNRALLHYVHDHIVLPNSMSVASASKELASLLFGTESDCKEQRLSAFLNTAIFRLSKSSWADSLLARISISTVIHHLAEDRRLPFLDSIIRRVIQTWSDPVFIQHASSRERLYMTTALLSLIAYLSNDDIQHTIMAETPLFHHVSTYFNSGDIQIAQLGAVVAEALSSRIDKEKPLNTTLLDSNPSLQELKGLVWITDAYDEPTACSVTMTPEAESEDETEETEELDPDADITLVLDRVVADMSHDIEDSNDEEEEEFEPYDMEEESEDEGLTNKEIKQTKKPVFIRDLIRCLQDRDDPLKLEIGLTAAEQVIRRKTGAGTELSESSINLARYLIGFPETYEIHDFRKLQQQALVALIVGVPESVTEFIIDQLYDRNTSTGQKQMILGAISSAVRELAGWSESDNTPELQIDQPQAGKQLFVSRRMEIERQNQHKIKRNRLSGLAGPVFFFPLLVGWWEGSQGHLSYWMGSSALLTERFVMTLNVILYSSNNLTYQTRIANTLDKRKIVKEYFEFALSMQYAAHLSVGTKRALLLGIDTIISICYQHQEKLLFSDYTKELVETKQWLEGNK
ncbi:Telomere length regulation protein TEL2 [Choanephora cucurbitarum]|uniref:Telomere length regulation protein TEL2 n=2 Tax=Choanephora cucurbitarum TaxID=101091 RepID=A0A1C7NLH0_9FUNG|nr:Telomere length regulation protein TEL2 [Choanephora cucurbitarum]